MLEMHGAAVSGERGGDGDVVVWRRLRQLVVVEATKSGRKRWDPATPSRIRTGSAGEKRKEERRKGGRLGGRCSEEEPALGGQRMERAVRS